MEKNLAKAATDARRSLQQVKKEYISMLEAISSKEEDKIDREELQNATELGEIKDSLQKHVDQMQEATVLVSKVTKVGSNMELVSQYGLLSENLQNLSTIKDAKVQESLQKVTHNVPLFQQCSQAWKKSREMKCQELKSPRAIAVLPNGDVAVGSWDKDMAIYSRDGNLKFKPIISVEKIMSFVAVGIDTFLVAGSSLEYFDTEWKKIPAHVELIGQNNKCITSVVVAFSIDKMGKLVSAQGTTVYLHNKDGSFASSFSMFGAVRDLVAITAKEDIAISCWDESVQLVNYSGNNIRHISPPPNVIDWEPWHLCCNENDNMLLIGNELLGEPKGVFMYTLSGIFQGQIVSGQFNCPFGLALSRNGKEVYFLDSNTSLIHVYEQPQITM